MSISLGLGLGEAQGYLALSEVSVSVRWYFLPVAVT